MRVGWEDIARYIGEYAGRSGGRPNTRLYMALANEALAVMSQSAGAIQQTWTGDDLQISGNIIKTPDTVAAITMVVVDGAVMVRQPWEMLAANFPDRADATRKPTHWATVGDHIELDSVVGDPVKVIGTGSLGEFSEAMDAPNPLDHVPAESKMLPAYYVVARLPMPDTEPSTVTTSGNIAFQTKTTQVLSTKQLHAELWEEGLARFTWAIRRRNAEQFRY